MTSTAPPPLGTEDTRKHVGWVVCSARRRRGWTVEQAVEIATLSTKTLVRIEAGLPARAQSWRSLAVALGLGDGDLLDALNRSDGYVGLAQRLGVRVPVTTTTPPAESPADAVALTGQLLATLAMMERSPAAERVMRSVLDWMPELAKA
jgi:hypothetical protein